LLFVCAGEYYQQHHHHYHEHCCYSSRLQDHTNTNNNTVEKERKERRAREGQTFSFVSALLASGKEMIEKLTVLIVITTTGKDEVPFTYVCVCVGEGRERV